MELDFVLLGRCRYALPCLITLGICCTFDVSEAGNRITDVGSVVNGLLAFFRKSKALIREILTATLSYFGHASRMANQLPNERRRMDSSEFIVPRIKRASPRASAHLARRLRSAEGLLLPIRGKERMLDLGSEFVIAIRREPA